MPRRQERKNKARKDSFAAAAPNRAQLWFGAKPKTVRLLMTFRDRVYTLTKTIPKGKVVTYGQLAKLAGHPKSARAVGIYMKTNPDAPRTPCHRVVAADGSLTGYSAPGGIAVKKKILTEEGVFFKGKKVDLARSQWAPV